MNTATAAALLINAGYADHMADYAAEVAALAPSYPPVLRSVRAWTAGPRTVVCNTTAPDIATLHAGIASDALDIVGAWLDGSPYPVPEGAAIETVSGRTFRLTW